MPRDASVQAKVILISLGYFPEPPVDLEAVAGKVGVTSIVLSNCRAGFTVYDAVGPVIHISSTASHSRFRFILAHEIAHVMLRLPNVNQHLDRTGRLVLLRKEEQLADQIATTLLIPDSWVEVMRKSFLGLTEIMQIAQKAEVSPELLIRRLAASRFDVAMLRWGREKSRWAILDRPGVPSVMHRCLAPSFSGQWTLENVGDEESNLVIDCYLDSRRIGIAGTGIRSKDDVLQLLRPSQSLLPPERSSMDEYRKSIATSLGC